LEAIAIPEPTRDIFRPAAKKSVVSLALKTIPTTTNKTKILKRINAGPNLKLPSNVVEPFANMNDGDNIAIDNKTFLMFNIFIIFKLDSNITKLVIYSSSTPNLIIALSVTTQ